MGAWKYDKGYEESTRSSISAAITNLATCITDTTNIPSIPGDFEKIQDINNVITGIQNIKLDDINSAIESIIEDSGGAEEKAKEKAAELAKGSELARYEEAKGKARLDRLLEEKKQYIHEKYSNETKILLEELKAEAQYSHDGSMVGYNEAMNNGDVKRVEEIMDNLVNKGKYSTENKETVTYICQTRSEFPKYELTDDEIRGLAAVCFSEQGNRKGAMMEASLIANRFEEVWEGKCYEATGGEGLYTMVGLPRDDPGYWFREAYKYMDIGVTDYRGNIEPVTDEMIEAVRLVFEDGYRVLPKDVIEHDEWSTDCWVYTLDGKQINRDECIPLETIIENKFGAKYIFVDWAGYINDDPRNNPDPFGILISSGSDDEIQEKVDALKNQPYFTYEEMGDYFNEEINDRVKPKPEE